MKKIVSLVLCVAALFALGAALTGCGENGGEAAGEKDSYTVGICQLMAARLLGPGHAGLYRRATERMEEAARKWNF